MSQKVDLRLEGYAKRFPKTFGMMPVSVKRCGVNLHAFFDLVEVAERKAGHAGCITSDDARALAREGYGLEVDPEFVTILVEELKEAYQE